MSKIKVVFRCTAGHEQQITFHDTPLAWVEQQVGLMDGTSPMYKYPPDDDSVIGRCGICGSQVKGEIAQETPVPDWRIGLSVQPASRTHPRYYEDPAVVIGVRPSGTKGIHCAQGVLQLKQGNHTFLVPADEWVAI